MGVPGNANALLLRSAAAAGGYQISRSLRFNSSDSAFLSRTPASAGNRKTWTWAGWVKRSGLGTDQALFSVPQGGGYPNTAIVFNSSNQLRFFASDASANVFANRVTSAVYRDTSAWMHIVVAVDYANAQSKIYVNGSEITAFATSTGPTNTDGLVNASGTTHVIGQFSNTWYFDGLLADIHFIDGQALTPSSFTEVSATTGQLIPKAYTGSFGTNGFWLKFSDNSAATATTLGKDYSGNGNNWTPNNLSVTAGAGNDSLVDTPTSYGTDTGAGGQVRGNYCTWNPLPTTTAKTFSDGNLQVVGSGADGFSRLYGTFGMSSGKWYFEVVPTTITGYVFIGISASEGNDYSSNAYYYYSATGAKTNRGAGSVLQAYGNSFTANDVIGVAVDMDTGKIWFAKNGTWQASGNPAAGTNAAYTDVLTYLKGAYVPYVTTDEFNSYTVVLNAGQRPFAYTAPSGFKALCDTNLPAPVVAKGSTAMDVLLWTGNGSNPRSLTGLNFNPDLVWSKDRNGTAFHRVADSVRGTGNKQLYTNSTDAENAYPDRGYISSFDSSGFTVNPAGSTAGGFDAYNTNATTYVGWCWDAGSSTVTNTQGSITSSVRANASAGFSIVTYTGANSTASTVGHGLGVVPGMVIVKNRTGSGYQWRVWHSYFGTSTTKTLLLSVTNGEVTGSTDGYITGLTSTVFGFGGGTAAVNASSTDYVAYCFAPVAGYSSFGSYTSNNSADGPFIYTGFKIRFLLVKQSGGSGNPWLIFDSARSTYNVVGNKLAPNSSVAEDDASIGNSTQNTVDFLSNGFKLRTANTGTNGPADTYIYAAFAESPFQFSRAR